MNRTSGVAIGAAVGLSLLAGCIPLRVGPVEPRPNVAFAGQTGLSLALELAQEVPGAALVPKTYSTPKTALTGWRTTLNAGFENGFVHAFKSPRSGSADLRLQLLRADLSWAPVAVSHGNAGASEALVTYRARLLDSAGKELGVAAGTARAKVPTVQFQDAEGCVASAVESAYEEIAEKLLVPAVRSRG
jgi:hypothetical protein